MKTTSSTPLRKIDRKELKSVKGAGPIRDRVCCTSNEDGFCCEWASDIWNCRYIHC
ncbi:hypothetical protein JET18_01170 [Chryseobacterium sp. L7]|uniref:Natural product n=1 Tax=Chryseobacterium endalhagicum TaxID=2797638 RepID=A0ABS1Q9Z3_9FLAO|nr:hypothetical protein [Chryseobacterium endalhagicum]MBL1219425.1 hypothetical protein [Chryseobacterium endalhagicum]